MEVIYKELESDKHWPQVELPAFLTRSPSSLHFLLASKAEATHRSGESSGIQRPRFEPRLSSSWLWVLQPLTASLFLGGKVCCGGGKIARSRAWTTVPAWSTEAVIIQLFWVNLGKKETAESLVCIACLPLNTPLHRHLSGQWEVKPCTKYNRMYDLRSRSEPQAYKVPTLASVLRCHHLGALSA